MKTKKFSKKMSLNKTTITHLDFDSMTIAKAGYVEPQTEDPGCMIVGETQSPCGIFVDTYNAGSTCIFTGCLPDPKPKPTADYSQDVMAFCANAE